AGEFPPDSNLPSSTEQSLDYRERSVVVSANQLLGRDFAVAARYRITAADLDSSFNPDTERMGQNVSATLQQLILAAIFNHPSGVFGQVNGIWSEQENYDYPAPPPGVADFSKGDHFWQLNLLAGYRFLQRHGEIAVGLLNVTDRDYRLNPLTLYSELPRDRTFV